MKSGAPANLARMWEADFRRGFDQAAIGMALVGLDGAWLRVNSAVCRMVGYSEEELLKTNFQNITHPDDLDADLNCVNGMLRDEFRSYQMEKRYIHKLGHSVWTMLSVTLVYGEEKSPICFFSQIQDINERKRAEEALRESDKRFQALLDNSPNLIFIKDVAGKYLVVNKKFETALGVRKQEVLGKGDEDVFPGEQAAAFRANDMRVLAAGSSMEFEEIAKHEDGLHTSIAHKFPLFDAAGKTYAIGGITTDITDRKKAEEQIRQKEAEHRRLIENVPEVVWKTDEQGRVIFISSKIEQVFGYSLQEIYRENERLWFSCMHAEDRERVQNAYSDLFHRGQAFDVEYRMQHRDGRWMWWHDRAATVVGNCDGAYAEGLLSDITDRKQMEQMLRQKHKMEAIGQLAGGLAHDFNNLLTVIKGNSQILSDLVTDPDARQKRSLDQIEKAADRAASLTRQLLAFSRMQILTPKVLDLNSVIAEMSKMLPRLITEEVEFIFTPDPRLGRFKTDPGQIEQVIMNLAVNARDAMPNGGKLVIETKNFMMDESYARQHPPAVPGPYILLRISDTGKGMDAETLSHIFEPFFTTKAQGKGTGLGLATVYGIIKQSGGFIWVASELDQGTTFEIYFPRVNDPIDVAPSRTRDEVSVRGTETILLAEDEDAVRELIAGFLNQNGYHVLEAKNGMEALTIAESGRRIDLLLTDMVMPKMGGWELTQRVATRRPELKILHMSGYSEYTPTLSSNEVGDLMQKPFSMDELGRKIREALKKTDRQEANTKSLAAFNNS